MPRKLRLKFPGACHRAINRGNYRMDIFQSERAKQAFASCLFVAWAKYDRRLHA